MRKKLLLVFIISFIAIITRAQQNPYAGLYKFSENYFRSDPFSGEFSDFLKHLNNDPAIQDKFTQRRTDTTLYAFQGVYTNYNPFFFKPKRVEILLEETPATYGDSLQVTDTIFTYQLIAYADNTAAGIAAVKNEFEKIHRQNKKKFMETSYREIKEGDKVTVGAYHFFIPNHSLSPLTVAWGILKDQQEIVLNITLRIKMSGNMAFAPTIQHRSRR